MATVFNDTREARLADTVTDMANRHSECEQYVAQYDKELSDIVVA